MELSSHPLELTTRFSAITTGAGAKNQRSAADAVEAGVAHLRYITRPNARAEIAWAGVSGDSQGDLHKALRARIRERAHQGGKGGARAAEKGIVSLPNDWPEDARQEAVDLIASHLAPDSSEATAVVVSHKDRPGNAHLHFLAVDGRESVEAARLRRPNAKRVRRANVIRLGDRGRPKELRGEIAEILNGIALRRGLQGVEWRSFEDRGIEYEPMLHEGPTRRSAASPSIVPDPRAAENTKRREQREPVQLDDDLDTFWTSGAAPMDLDEFEEPVLPRKRPSPPSQPPVRAEMPPKKGRSRFQGLRERVREWVRGRGKTRPPRSR
jgi:hypothetical protein